MVTKEVVYPTVYFTLAKFMDQMYMADFVKSFSKIQYAEVSKSLKYLKWLNDFLEYQWNLLLLLLLWRSVNTLMGRGHAPTSTPLGADVIHQFLDDKVAG